MHYNLYQKNRLHLICVIKNVTELSIVIAQTLIIALGYADTVIVSYPPRTLQILEEVNGIGDREADW